MHSTRILQWTAHVLLYAYAYSLNCMVDCRGLVYKSTAGQQAVGKARAGLCVQGRYQPQHRTPLPLLMLSPYSLPPQ